jgi:hypothetical protein
MSGDKFVTKDLFKRYLKRFHCLSCRCANVIEAKHVAQLIGSILIFFIARLYVGTSKPIEVFLVLTSLIILLFLLTEKRIGDSNTFNLPWVNSPTLGSALII